MTIEQIFDSLSAMLQAKYPGRTFHINKPKFKDDLQNKFNQDLNNITLPMNVLEMILLNPLPVADYAEANGISYSSIIKNKDKYCSLSTHGGVYCIAEYELLHNKRLGENYGKQTEYIISKNQILVDALLVESYKHNKSVPSIIYTILRKHFGV